MRHLRTAAVLACIPLSLALLPPRGAAQARNDNRAWEWVASGAAVAGAALLDQPVQRWVHGDSSAARARLARIGDRLGRRKYPYAALAALYGVGRLSGNERLSDDALHTAGALLVTGLATEGLKFAVGRARPDTPGSDGDDFRPFHSGDRWSSFPSRHTVTAFTLAAAAAEEIDDPWVSAAAYGAAIFVGWSRVQANRHWASDVLSGAILATALTRGMMRTLHSGDDPPPDADARRSPSPPLYLVFAVPVP